MMTQNILHFELFVFYRIFFAELHFTFSGRFFECHIQ